MLVNEWDTLDQDHGDVCEWLWTAEIQGSSRPTSSNALFRFQGLSKKLKTQLPSTLSKT